MPNFIALLRGINVGKAKRVPMAKLRELLEGLGYARVRTLLNSGNALFDAECTDPDQHALAIERSIADALGLAVPVIVLDAARLRRVVCDNPFATALSVADHARLLVVFAQQAQALAPLSALEPLLVEPEQLRIGADAAYLWCATGLLESKAGAALLGKLGRPFTTRNWATTLKLQVLSEHVLSEQA